MPLDPGAVPNKAELDSAGVHNGLCELLGSVTDSRLHFWAMVLQGLHAGEGLHRLF